MEWQILKLAAIFLAIVILIWCRRPLYRAILAGIAATAVLYGIGPLQMGDLLLKAAGNWNDMSILYDETNYACAKKTRNQARRFMRNTQKPDGITRLIEN